jgi:hypothetical protein
VAFQLVTSSYSLEHVPIMLNPVSGFVCSLVNTTRACFGMPHFDGEFALLVEPPFAP